MTILLRYDTTIIFLTNIVRVHYLGSCSLCWQRDWILHDLLYFNFLTFTFLYSDYLKSLRLRLTMNQMTRAGQLHTFYKNDNFWSTLLIELFSSCSITLCYLLQINNLNKTLTIQTDGKDQDFTTKVLYIKSYQIIWQHLIYLYL